MLDILEGIWEGRGRGGYPSIEDFEYLERVELRRLEGKMVLAYTQRTRSTDGEPLHSESGFLRFDGDDAELVLAQATGIVEVHHGRVSGARLEFSPWALARSPRALEVSEVRRALQVDGDVLSYRLEMAAVGHPLTRHLTAELHRR